MLSLREQLAKGLFTLQSDCESIPKKAEFKGTITPDGYCDFEVQEDVWFLNKDSKRGERMMRSERARNQRKELKVYKNTK